LAIIGIGCKFPGNVNSPEEFWDFIVKGGDGVTEVPADRWNVDAKFSPDFRTAGKISVRKGGFIKDIDKFDAPFFGISPMEATRMDPQQRMALELSYAAIEDAGLLSALKREDDQYLFYLESNTNSSIDSSLLYNPTTEQFSLFQIAQGEGREYSLGPTDLRTLLMNHIAVGTPKGLSRKEFFKNLTGNYIIVDNETGEVSGTSPTSIGYQGLTQKPNFPTEITSDADNGISYDIENYFSFSSPDMYLKIQSSYPVFYDLLRQSGLANTYEIMFLSDNENYTVFIPSDSALIVSQVDTLDQGALQDLLKFHFIQGNLILTDGIQPSGYYETARVDEKSTTFTTIFSTMFIDPGYDLITIGDAQGGTYTGVEESAKSNIMTGRDIGEGNEVFRNLIINGVIHEIDRVLMFTEVDTE